MKSYGKSPRRVMVTRGECFWVACNRLIISFFCVYVVREGKKVVSDGSRVCHRCIVLLLFVECMDLWQLVSTQLLGGYTSLQS